MGARNRLRILLVVGVALGTVGLLLVAIGSMGRDYPLPCLGGCPYSTSPTYTIARDEIQAGYAVAVSGIMVLAIWLKLGSKTAKVGSDENHSNATSGV